MQRLRQLALRRPGARRGRCSQMYDGATDVKTCFRVREFRRSGQINTHLRAGAPVITYLCFSAGRRTNLWRTLREGRGNVDTCSMDAVIHSFHSQGYFDSPIRER